MGLNFRDYAIILLILLNIYNLEQVRKNNSLVAELQSLPANLESLNKVQTKMAAAINAIDSTRVKVGSGASSENLGISDDSLIAMIQKSVSEQLAASSAKIAPLDKQPDAVRLRMLQDRIDMFEKKFSERLSIKGGLNNNKEKNDKLNALAAKIKDEVLSQCRK